MSTPIGNRGLRASQAGRGAQKRQDRRASWLGATAAICATAAAAVLTLELKPVDQAFATTQLRGPALAAGVSKGFAQRSRTTLRAEDFDPFGWKGQMKDTVEGLMTSLQGDDEPPSRLEEQMIAQIFEQFDLDKDGTLNLEEFNALQKKTEGDDATYDSDQLVELLRAVSPGMASPEKGMPFAEYRSLYAEGKLRRAYNTNVQKDYEKIFGKERLASITSAGSSTDKELRSGAKVVIEGLQGNKDLNGLEGTVSAPLETEAELVAEGRLVVTLPDGDRVALKPANVKPVVSTPVD
eukprot:TRINITY_DN4097_c3_g1_i1.p1 TRINITY_DN4097_c3_g1~~TRINITY_DN4097_c3_g1_i1.p1  ORF type:complete len:295 (-),score=80.32 TRINITY_DN4097_c3_g1_i1:154-1038(-)